MDIHERIKTKYGECRCCLAKGNHQDMTQEYYYNGIREVFVDIFLECFNYCLSKTPQLSTLICSSCVSRLRDASSFRMMVMSNEEQLLHTFTRPDNKHAVYINVPSPSVTLDIKSALKLEGVKAEPSEPSDAEDNSSFDLKNYACDAETHTVEGEKALLSRYAGDVLKPLPTRRQLLTICPNYAKRLKVLRGRIVKSSSIEKLIISDNEPKLSEKRGQIININTILEFSNAMPFKCRSCVGFRCFYCPAIFDTLSLLREHSVKHDKSVIKKLLNSYPPYRFSRLIINIDVSDLKCSLCDQLVPNVDTLKTHLIKVHDKEYHHEYMNRLIPYKLVNNFYECQVCSENFVTFGTIEKHMNVHYKNYLCSECGLGFVTENRLRVHSFHNHKNGSFPCEQCSKVLPTKQTLKMHIEIRHNMLKRFKCPKCNERFKEYYPRQKHMSEVHGIEPAKFICSECGRPFLRRYGLSRHMKRNHLEEKDHHCAHCSYRCFSTNELRLHMIKHTGEKKFQCTVCNKALSRKKSLTEHMKIHNNDRRFVCSACGQAFVQKCSLKGHMKTHHNNMDNKLD